VVQISEKHGTRGDVCMRK